MTVFKTLLIAFIVVIAGILAFVYSGVYNVAADEPHWAVTRWLLETTQEQSIELRANEVDAPVDLADSERYRRGALNYATMCEVCHLAPGVSPTPAHRGLKPEPPDLAEVALEHSPEYKFWAVKHGIKMTGMPAWGETHPDAAIWDIVAFVEQLSELTPRKYAQLTSKGKGRGERPPMNISDKPSCFTCLGLDSSNGRRK